MDAIDLCYQVLARIIQSANNKVAYDRGYMDAIDLCYQLLTRAIQSANKEEQ